MGYNQQDAYNLNRAQAMFDSTDLETGLHDEILMLFPITKATYDDDACKVLTEVLMSATRSDEHEPVDRCACCAWPTSRSHPVVSWRKAPAGARQGQQDPLCATAPRRGERDCGLPRGGWPR
jgi:hypothetical protein